MRKKQSDIVYIGNLSLDNIACMHASSFSVPGGAALYGALASTLFGARVSLIGFIGKDYPVDVLRNISKYGIDTRLLSSSNEHTTRFDLRYDTHMRLSSMTVRSPLFNYFFTLEIPRLNTKLVNISTNPLPVQKTLMERISAMKGIHGPILAMQTHGLYLKGEDSQILMNILEKVDLFFASETDLKELFDRFANLSEIARELSTRVRKCTCITRGEKGVLIALRRSPVVCMNLPRANVVDPTGAGDAFVGAFLASYLKTEDPIVASISGHIAACIAVTAIGPHSLFELLDTKLRLARRDKGD